MSAKKLCKNLVLSMVSMHKHWTARPTLHFFKNQYMKNIKSFCSFTKEKVLYLLTKENNSIVITNVPVKMRIEEQGTILSALTGIQNKQLTLAQAWKISKWLERRIVIRIWQRKKLFILLKLRQDFWATNRLFTRYVLKSKPIASIKIHVIVKIKRKSTKRS